MPALTLTQPPNTSPLSLAQHLALVPDTRHDQGKRHALVAVLNLVAAAVLCGMRSLQAIAQFGRALTRDDEAQPASATHYITPCKSTLSEVYAASMLTVSNAVARPGQQYT